MRETAIASSRRTDDHLLFIMDQTAEWTVHGRAGAVLGLCGSLREALKAVFQYEATGVHVFAISSHPRADVVVFREQAERVADADGRIERPMRRNGAAGSPKPGHPSSGHAGAGYPSTKATPNSLNAGY